MSATSDVLLLEGMIERVCWRYAIRLGVADLNDFLAVMAQPVTAKVLAERPGLLLPFIFRLFAAVPRFVFALLRARWSAPRTRDT
ncbi:MAG: hypothetical protein KGO02_24845 [Alphaproteobacteria bacterium]|nr:hypothetical protein [Alphaproteobacteria bacterium]